MALIHRNVKNTIIMLQCEIYLNTVNVLKFRTIIFSVVRNFRNYVPEKLLVFVILGCGL